jgi:transposase
MEVIAAVDRRRRWSRVEKERLVAASFEPGVTASDVARRAGIHVSQLFRWRKELSDLVPKLSFAPVMISPQPEPNVVDEPHVARRARANAPVTPIEIVLGDGAVVRVGADVDEGVLRQVLRVLQDR